MTNRGFRAVRFRAGAVLLSLTVIAAGCGGTKADDTKSDGATKADPRVEYKLTAADGESGLADAGEPKRGGKLVYGLEDESTNGFCLSDAQLAISGMMVVRAFYDTLTQPNAEGNFEPYLAKSVEPNADFTEWTITLRDGITFHDGTKLDATVVKNNLDAYRGKYPARNALLFAFTLDNIKDVTTTGPMAVKVTTKKPWANFPAQLYSSGRMGMMAQSQLDSTSCSDKLVGTGPFKFVSWTKNSKLVGEANPDYWQTAPDGKPYPYVDSIEFRPINSGEIRNQSIESGSINIMHTSNGEDIVGKLRKLRDAGKTNMLVSEDFAEVSFFQLNNSKAPFDDPEVRQALAMGSDRADINNRVNSGLPNLATGPFAPDSIAYLKDAGFPKYDLAAAKKAVAALKAKGKKLDFVLSCTTDPSVVRTAELIQQAAKKLGVNVTLKKMDQATLISRAIAKDYDAMVFRNYPGGDPDLNYVWWYGKNGDGTGGNPVNFAGFDDPEVNRLLDEGRSESDPAKRKQIYQDLNRRMATQVFGVWGWYTPWAIVEASNVHGILGPPLPGDDPSKPGTVTTDDKAKQPSTGLATGHSLLGLWIAS